MGDQIPDRATVQMAKAKVSTNVLTGIGTILIKIPSGGRKINGGIGWFASPGNDDSFEVYVTDEDNILGGGAGAIISGYTDTDLPEENRGWYCPIGAPYTAIERMVEFGTLPENLYLKIVAKKGVVGVDTFRANIHWGKIG